MSGQLALRESVVLVSFERSKRGNDRASKEVSSSRWHQYRVGHFLAVRMLRSVSAIGTAAANKRKAAAVSGQAGP